MLLCYGAHSNIALLEHYGFAIDDNPNDRVLLSPTAGIARAAEAAAETPSAGVDGDGGGADADSKHFLRRDGRPSWHLLASLRLAALTKEQRRKLGHTVASGAPVSDENEARGSGVAAPLLLRLGICGWGSVSCASDCIGSAPGCLAALCAGHGAGAAQEDVRDGPAEPAHDAQRGRRNT